MKEKISVQKIANELNISRNTVSKVINNHPVPEATKVRVIQKAIELGYKGFNLIQDNNHKKEKQVRILLLAGKPLSNLDFFISLVRGVEDLVSQYNIDFFQYTLNKKTTYEQLKNYISSLNIDGIIGIELYDEALLENVLMLDAPLVLIDASLNITKYQGHYDAILMQSREPIYQLCTQLINHGHQRFSYVGDHKHCVGFYERFLGMRDALADIGHRLDLKQSLIFTDGSPYGDMQWLIKKITALPVRPKVFICSNDSIAINVVQALQKLRIRIPQDAQVIGFDNIIDAALNKPSITTIGVDKELLGKEAIQILLDRINRIDVPNRMIYIKTDIIYRETTMPLKKL